jgi:hypothetical protein
MKSRGVAGLVVLVLSVLSFPGCESTTTNAPPVTASLVRAGTREHANSRMLADGRSALLNRCIQCHAPPDVAKFSPETLRKILATMSDRAHLSPEEHVAVLKYLLTVRSL